ncbi:hypothetical protein ACFWGR_19400 [Streptomyces sp. NPDC060311]
MLKQLACHLLYAIPGQTGGPTWDLEAEHPNIPWEEVLDPSKVLDQECNWGFIGIDCPPSSRERRSGRRIPDGPRRT